MKSPDSINILFVLSLFLTAIGCDTAGSQPPDGENGLIWSDEFDTDGAPDATKWTYDIGGHGWGNQEKQYYTNQRKNSRVENGMLIIEAHKESFLSNEYTSGRLVTKNKGDWKYGRIEVRAKLPAGTGTWPAIWMLPTGNAYGGWPNSGEIDIMEHVGYDPAVVHANVHTKTYNHTLGTNKGNSANVATAESAFHVYAIEWSENEIDFFVDGSKYFSFANENTGFEEWPFDQPFHLLLNIAVGGTWGGSQGINDDIFPQRLEVDYVRVYELPD